MSTAGDRTAASASAGAYEGGGAGGKFRKRPLRRNQATPYDRPPMALRNPSWLTKLVVDPPSKLIASGAYRFFSPMFGPSQESQNLPQESRPNEGGDNDACSSGDDAFSKLEQLLKQKNFTRTEIDRLTELLHSKSVDMSVGDEEKRAKGVQSRHGLDSSSSLPFTFGASSAAPQEISGPSTSSSGTPGIFTLCGSCLASSTNTVTITPSIFNFGANSTSSSTSAVKTLGTPAIFNVGGSSSTSPANASNTSTSATPGIFSFGTSSSTSLTNTGSIVHPSPFNFGATLASSQASSTAGIFESVLQPPKSTGFTSSFSSSNPSGFTFGASSSSFATPSMSPVVFGSTPSWASSSTFSFGSTSSTNTPSPLLFGNSVFAASPGNNYSMEDSMQAPAPTPTPTPTPAPAVPFGQPSFSPSPAGFAFGSAPSPFWFGSQQRQPSVSPSPAVFGFGSAPSPYWFGSQQSQSSPFAASSSLGQAAPQNSSPCATTSNSLIFGGGGSFWLGSSGPDKSGREIMKVNRNKNRRK